MVDCRLGRIAIWQELHGEKGTAIAAFLNKLFLERGPMGEIQMDNCTTFKSAPVKAVLDR